jgi:methylmalonyl-CoA/ethylmalonyl-CoA epimerase
MNVHPALHHVGIVQPDENEALAQMSLFGLEEEYRGFVPRWSALCIFTKAAQGSRIEFVIPNGGPLASFNKGVGGLHHVALQVPDLDEVAVGLHARGMKLLEAEHVRGAGQFICNFLSPSFTRGLIVEYVQLIDPSESADT